MYVVRKLASSFGHHLGSKTLQSADSTSRIPIRIGYTYVPVQLKGCSSTRNSTRRQHLLLFLSRPECDILVYIIVDSIYYIEFFSFFIFCMRIVLLCVSRIREHIRLCMQIVLVSCIFLFVSVEQFVFLISNF